MVKIYPIHCPPWRASEATKKILTLSYHRQKGGTTAQNCLKTAHDLFDKHKYGRPRVGFAGTTGHPKFPKDSILSCTFSSKVLLIILHITTLVVTNFSIAHHFLVVGLQENDGSSSLGLNDQNQNCSPISHLTWLPIDLIEFEQSQIFRVKSL